MGESRKEPSWSALLEPGLAMPLAVLLGVTPVVFPGDHGAFAANQWSPNNDPAAFAEKLREVLG